MASESAPAVGDQYVLPTGKADAARLDVIHAVYGPLSTRALADAGIAGARRAADIGTGTGTVARWMASQLRPDGRVDAIDIAPEQLAVAQGIAGESGSAAIHYQPGSAYEPGLPAGSFDIVFCRLVLCHLREPQAAVAQMAALLRPGGRLVLVDMDLRDIYTMPPCEAYAQYLEEAVIPYERKIGVDYSVGRRLPQLLTDAGLETQAVLIDQPAYRDGPGKHLWEQTWAVALQRAVPEGVVGAERGAQLLAAMAEHTSQLHVWVAVAKMYAAIGSRREAA